MQHVPGILPRGILIVGCLLLLALLAWACRKDGDNGDELNKRMKLTMIKYDELHQTEEAESGFRLGLAEAGLREGVDFELVTRNAQGDMATMRTMLDVVGVDGTDMLISLQTPTLHAAVKRRTDIPLVFMVVANPFLISTIGVNDSTHMESVTGVYTNTAFDEMLQWIKSCMPDLMRIGTLYAHGELNAVFYRDQLQSAAQRIGLEAEIIPVGSRTAIPQATQQLCDLDIDAIVQIEDNLTSATFPAIIRVARENNLPVFSFVDVQASQGAVMVYAPDYKRGGEETGLYAARVLRGESPGDIPFGHIKKFDLIINEEVAETMGITIPPEVLARASELLRKGG